MFFLDRRKLHFKKLIRRQKRKAFIQKIKNIRGKSFKLLCWIIELHAITCITLSYVLAFMDKMNPLESLSSTITTEIIAPIAVLGFTRMIENVFEHNQLSFSTPLDYLKKKNNKDEKDEEGAFG